MKEDKSTIWQIIIAIGAFVFTVIIVFIMIRFFIDVPMLLQQILDKL